MHTLRCILRFPFTLAFLAFIFVICLIPIPETPLSDMSLIDKWTHIVLYAVLVCVFSLEYLLSDLHFPRILLCFLTLVMPLFTGALIEVMQTTLTTYRSGDILDFVADAVGVAAGGLFAAFVISPLVSLWRPKKERRQTP